MREGLKLRFADAPDAALALALLLAAVILVCIALRPGHHLFKATVLAWVVLP